MKYGYIHTYLGWLQITGLYQVAGYWARTGTGLGARSWFLGKDQYDAASKGKNIE